MKSMTQENAGMWMVDGRGISVDLVTVTPEVAARWLEERNVRNRKPSQQRIARYKRLMEQGQWVFNGATVVFDADGRLADGQNRLHAIVASGVPQSVLVVSGVEPFIAQDTTDQGGKRTLGNQLDMRGEQNATNLATAIRVVYAIETAGELDSTNRTAAVATIPELIATLDRNPRLRESMPVGGRVNKAVGYSHGLGAAMHYLLSQIDPDDAEVFFARLVDGVGLEDGDPILLLRNRLIAERDVATGARHKGMNQNFVAALTIKAWKAWRRGDRLNNLRWRRGGAQPEAFPRLDEGEVIA